MPESEAAAAVAAAVTAAAAAAGKNPPATSTAGWSERAAGPLGGGTVFETIPLPVVENLLHWAHHTTHPPLPAPPPPRPQITCTSSEARPQDGESKEEGGTDDNAATAAHETPTEVSTAFPPLHGNVAEHPSRFRPIPSRTEPPPRPTDLSYLLKCAEAKIQHSYERAKATPGAESAIPTADSDKEDEVDEADEAVAVRRREAAEKVGRLERLRNRFDSSALVAFGVAVEEVLTATLTPLAVAHVSRCRELERTSRSSNDRKRRRADERGGDAEGGGDDNVADSRRNSGGSSDGRNESASAKESSDPFHAWTMPVVDAVAEIAKGNASRSRRPMDECFLPSALPSGGSHRTTEGKDTGSNDSVRSEVAASRWCAAHGLETEFVLRNMDALFGTFLPTRPSAIPSGVEASARGEKRKRADDTEIVNGTAKGAVLTEQLRT